MHSTPQWPIAVLVLAPIQLVLPKQNACLSSGLGAVQCFAPVRLCEVRADCARPATDRDATIVLRWEQNWSDETQGDQLVAGSEILWPQG